MYVLIDVSVTVAIFIALRVLHQSNSQFYRQSGRQFNIFILRLT